MLLTKFIQSSLLLQGKKIETSSIYHVNIRLFNYDHWYKAEIERDKRAKEKAREETRKKSLLDITRDLAKLGVQEIKKAFDEYRSLEEDRSKAVLQHGDFETLFKFNSKEDIEKWTTNTDSAYELGKSTAMLQLSPQNTGLFQGYLSNEFNKPEKTKSIYTGYANITSKTNYKAFQRVKNFNLQGFTHFMLKVRGDGRSYMFVLGTPQYFTLTWTYVYSYPLYTHGGPYWQTIKIPFSKFLNITHGRVSDRQTRLPPLDVKNLGITCMDGIEGPFCLEIDQILVYKDNEIKEDCAYENYLIPKYVGNT